MRWHQTQTLSYATGHDKNNPNTKSNDQSFSELIDINKLSFIIKNPILLQMKHFTAEIFNNFLSLLDLISPLDS